MTDPTDREALKAKGKGNERTGKRRGRAITLFSLAFNLPVIALAVMADLQPAAAMAVAVTMAVLNGWLLYIRRRERDGTDEVR